MGWKYGAGRTCQGWATAPGKGCPCTQHPACRRDAQLWDHRRDAREPRVILPGLCQPPHRRSREAVRGGGGKRQQAGPGCKPLHRVSFTQGGCKSTASTFVLLHGPRPHSPSRGSVGFPGNKPGSPAPFLPPRLSFQDSVTWASVPISRWDCIPVAGLSTSCCD